jgi:hypothetical protein
MARLATVRFLMAIEQSNRAYREIGFADSHHGPTHHGGDKEKIEKCIRINQFQVARFAWFTGRLKATKDGDGTLFDRIMVTYGNGLGKGSLQPFVRFAPNHTCTASAHRANVHRDRYPRDSSWHSPGAV